MPAKRISSSKRALILAALCEGMAINSVCRMFSVGKNSVLRVITETGEACEDWHNKHFKGIELERLELDEQWAYVHTHKERMSKEQKQQHPDRGDCWLWAGIDPKSKAIIGWRTGKRTAHAASSFANDLAHRIIGRVQITSDALNGYEYAIPFAFHGRVDYAQEVKTFLNPKFPEFHYLKRRVEPLARVDRTVIIGSPDLHTSTVCHMERYFLTMRQGNKRCARKTLAYSKSWDNHALTASLHIFVYNLCRKHEITKQTPAQALGIVKERWTLEDVVKMTEAYLEAKDAAEFEKAFAGFKSEPKSQRTYTPTPKHMLLTPWYLDKESGGPNPKVKTPGIKYDP